MATTWIKPIHAGKGASVLSVLGARIGYVEDIEKTEDGRLVSCHECEAWSADNDFANAKRRYDRVSARGKNSRDIIAYHVRQAFRPGEITPEKALEVGHELAMRFTKGSHAFVAAVHTDREHVHCHIIFNSITLDYTRKFRNFLGSSFALRRLSDTICVENGLSIIEAPGRGGGRGKSGRTDAQKAPTWREKIRDEIDVLLPQSSSFEALFESLREAGYTVNENRKHISLMAPGMKGAVRLRSLGEGYDETALREKITSRRVAKKIENAKRPKPQKNVSLLVDIERKLLEGKGAGYAHWAKVFNLKEAARTLLFLQENGIDDHDDLAEKSTVATSEFNALLKKIKGIEERQKSISDLQKQIGIYSKTRDTYMAYKASGWDESFREIHAADIIRHEAARKYFSENVKGKIPKMAALKQEYATLANEKKRHYTGYRKLKELSRDLAIAKANADRILGITEIEKTEEKPLPGMMKKGKDL